ncbi:hypothetical protein BH18ACT10_BH18ACT10_08110 [soil metagenome]
MDTFLNRLYIASDADLMHLPLITYRRKIMA